MINRLHNHFFHIIVTEQSTWSHTRTKTVRIPENSDVLKWVIPITGWKSWILLVIDMLLSFTIVQALLFNGRVQYCIDNTSHTFHPFMNGASWWSATNHQHKLIKIIGVSSQIEEQSQYHPVSNSFLFHLTSNSLLQVGIGTSVINRMKITQCLKINHLSFSTSYLQATVP